MLSKFSDKINRYIAPIGLFLFLTIFSLAPQTSLAQRYDFNKNSGLDISAEKGGFVTGKEAESVDSIIAMVIYVILGFVGTIFLALIIYSGVMWSMTQESEKINKAKDVLYNAIIGLVITLGAYVISYFIITNFT